MKLGIAQCDISIGDLDALSTRILEQADVAVLDGVSLLCFPAPLIAGVHPGSLLDDSDFESSIMHLLVDIAQKLSDTGLRVLIPGPVSFASDWFFEFFLLTRGSVKPLRLMKALEAVPGLPFGWEPPVFEIDGLRFSASFDASRDIDRLPAGIDCLLYFPVDSFCAADQDTAGASGLVEGCDLVESISRAGVWLAMIQPVGSFDAAIYTGGSCVLDDSGSMRGIAPSFEEFLLIQAIDRSAIRSEDAPLTLAAPYDRSEWTWEALRLFVRDSFLARSNNRAILLLDGGLADLLLAVLLVDALGARNVIGVLVSRERIATPRTRALEDRRCALIRDVAARLHISLVERVEPDDAAVFDDDVPMAAGWPVLDRSLQSMILSGLAVSLDALPVSSFTKTDAALSASWWVADPGVIAPFGDVYLTALEFLARFRNRRSEVLPAALVSMPSVVQAMKRCLERGLTVVRDKSAREQAFHVLAQHKPDVIDGTLSRFVEGSEPMASWPLAKTDVRAAKTLALLVQEGEWARRRMPLFPVISLRSFSERQWPCSLRWIPEVDLGEPRNALDLAQVARAHGKEAAEEGNGRAREEVYEYLGNLLGIDPEQVKGLGDSEETDISDEAKGQLGEALRRFFAGSQHDSDEGGGAAAAPGAFPSFSKN